MAEHNDTGKRGEETALKLLQSKGMKLLARNWRAGRAEVDLIMMDQDLIVIVEVKTRSSDFFGDPEEAITRSKQKMLMDAAEEYLWRNNLSLGVRYDLVSVVISGSEIRTLHIEDAFYPFAEGS